MSYEGARGREGLSLSPSGSDVMATDTRSVFLSGPNPLLVLLLQYILPPVLLQPDRVTILTSVAKSVRRAATEAGLLHPQRYANFRESSSILHTLHISSRGNHHALAKRRDLAENHFEIMSILTFLACSSANEQVTVRVWLWEGTAPRTPSGGQENRIRAESLCGKY